MLSNKLHGKAQKNVISDPLVMDNHMLMMMMLLLLLLLKENSSKCCVTVRYSANVKKYGNTHTTALPSMPPTSAISAALVFHFITPMNDPGKDALVCLLALADRKDGHHAVWQQQNTMIYRFIIALSKALSGERQ